MQTQSTIKKCIWCSRELPVVSFNKQAHIVPRALGGKLLCPTVCDECNAAFGKKNSSGPSVEEAIKETFFISRLAFLAIQNQVGKNKAVVKTETLYFKIDLPKRKLILKTAYKLKRNFQEHLCRQVKRGLYKMFLEETERLYGTAMNDRYNFMRQFARYDFGDYPVLYFERQYGVILQGLEDARAPRLYLETEMRFKYLVCDHGFHEFEFLGHVFGLPVSNSWSLTIDKYLHETEHKKLGLFKGYKLLRKYDDIDFALKVMK
jgi:hypothetical protein